MSEKKLDDLPPSYTNLGFDAESVAGPSAPVIQDATPSYGSGGPAILPTAPAADVLGPPGIRDYTPPSMAFENVYDACVNYVKDHCCYGSRFINQMKLTEIDNKRALHYKLKSYGEKRESAIKTVPYKGGPVDGPENGPAPSAWDMVVTPPLRFEDCKQKYVVPHTEYVRTCQECGGSGRVTCRSCSGSGHGRCWSCSGSGRNSENNTCSSCGGSGTTACSRCSGRGRVTCGICDGYGKIKKYTVLIVTWKTHPCDYFTGSDCLPADVLVKGEAVTLFSRQEKKLQPITDSPDETVNAASAYLLQKHDSAFPNELIIRQWHALEAIPFTRVKYSWKDREGEFYVFGTNRKVYFEEYPQRCCCCTCC